LKTVDITGFFKKFCITTRTNIAKVLCTLAILFFHFTLSQPPTESPPAALFANAKQIGFEAGLAPSSSPTAL
jgi:hypothetical protein